MACNGNCNCNCKDQDLIVDESGFVVGKSTKTEDPWFQIDASGPVVGTWYYSDNNSEENDSPSAISYKYAEDKILADLKAHLDATYTEHYATENRGIECFDAWIALGDSTPTFRNTALKYLWRYGKKNGSNKKDLMKALHYIFMCLYVDHYRSKDD